MIDGNLIAGIVILVLLLILCGIIYYAYCRIRNKVRHISNMAFGTPSITEGFQKMEREEEITPKSVSSATSLYLPSIMKDFPEFHYDEMKERAENVIISYLRSISTGNVQLLTEGTNELKEQLQMYIQMLENKEQKEYFDKIKVHRIEIHKYRKEKGRCSVVMQSSVEYIHYIEQEKQVISGSKERLEQTRYNVEVIYIQDRDMVENLGDAGLGLNCPNCGAPITGLGAKKCAYCDTPIIEWNIRTWNFSEVQNVT